MNTKKIKRLNDILHKVHHITMDKSTISKQLI